MKINKEKLTTWKPYLSYVLWYTLAFGLVCMFALIPFVQHRMVLVWKVDGMPQYAEWFRYTGHYLRSIIINALHGDFHLKMYDFSIGFGGDVRTFLKTDPFVFLGALVWRRGWVVQAFSLVVLLRIYIMGLSFSCYAFYMESCRRGVQALEILKKDFSTKRAILVAALIYTFSNYTFTQVIRHPQFAMATIMLPMLFIGLEQVIKRQNFLFYSLMVAISLMTSYYFLYINTFIMGVYALLRLFDHYEKNRVKEFFCMLGRIIVSYLLGCGMSAVFFAPSIASYFLSSRSSSGTQAAAVGSLLHYSWKRIPKLLMGIYSPVVTSGYLTTISVGAVMVPILILLFSRKWKDKRTLKLGLIIGMVCMTFPIFGYIMSGFSTVNNRFSYGFVFAMAMAAMYELNRIKSLNNKHLIACGVCILASVIFVFIAKPDDACYYIGIVELAAVVAVLAGMKIAQVKSEKMWNALVIALVCVTTGFTGFYIYSDKGMNMIEEFQPYATGNSWFTSSRFHYFANMPDDEFYRTDTDMMFNNYNNVSVTMDYNGVSLYNSTIGANTINYFVESESTGISAINRTLSLDNRTAQEALACVQYYLTEKKDGAANVPYGFKKDASLLTESEVYDMYVNENLLSIGYSYDTVISRSEYEKLSAVEKQQVQLQRAVLDDEDMADFTDLKEDNGLSGDVSKGTFTITSVDKGMKHKGKKFKVKENMKVKLYTDENGVERSEDLSPKIHFETESKENCEVYLRIKDISGTCKLRSDVNVYIDGVEKRAIYRKPADTYTLGLDDFVINLGYYENAEKIEGEMSFSSKGKYTIDEFEIYYVSMDNYEDELASLSDQDLENEVVNDDYISGKVSTKDDKLMTFSIPYNVGWKAYVDGKETKLYKVNTLYMGLRLEEGEHDIVLKYASPGIKYGAMISAACTIIFLLLFVRWLKKRKMSKGL